MSKEITTTFEYQATPEQVWAVLTDFDAYPEWNPFILSLRGKPEPGARWDVFLQPPGARGMRFQPLVKVWESGHTFAWEGSLGFRGLFDGYHMFRLEALGGGRTRLIHGERFRGILAGLILRFIRENTRKGFESMNAALAQRLASQS
ncbi:MAG: SRPBCC domain-containing protein [Bacteroidetes bacterium]|nr:MAG: SRPBCC domain-containing protein [Bacteroidota bacterium]